MLFGYARVSTAEQNPDHQVDALLHAGAAAKDIYLDHASGANASRPALDTVLRMLRDGDTLKLTRLAPPPSRPVPAASRMTTCCHLADQTAATKVTGHTSHGYGNPSVFARRLGKL